MAFIKDIDWERVKEWAKENKRAALLGVFAIVVVLAVLAEQCSGS